eukprot:gene23344-180_t
MLGGSGENLVYCNRCTSECTSCLICLRCNLVTYCAEDCVLADWDRHTREECVDVHNDGKEEIKFSDIRSVSSAGPSPVEFVHGKARSIRKIPKTDDFQRPINMSLRDSMELEWDRHSSLTKGEWNYVFGAAKERKDEDTGVVYDMGREGWSLNDFCKQPHALEAQLKLEEVIALRLYTGPCRHIVDKAFAEQDSNFRSTLHCVNQGFTNLITRLRRQHNHVLYHVCTAPLPLDLLSMYFKLVGKGTFQSQPGCIFYAPLWASPDASVARNVALDTKEKNSVLAIHTRDACAADLSFVSQSRAVGPVVFPPYMLLCPHLALNRSEVMDITTDAGPGTKVDSVDMTLAGGTPVLHVFPSFNKEAESVEVHITGGQGSGYRYI